MGQSKVGAAAGGAISGAATGATIGSVAGPYGTAIGGAVGFIGGGIAGFLGAGGGDEPISAPIRANISDGWNWNNAEYYRQQVAVNRQLQEQMLAQGGIQNQNNVFQQMQALSGGLQDQANGVGPNPAMAQFNNQTANNIQNQAALMASQRGVSANSGMLARQAAMQGGNLQQQAVGQAAALQAQQQIAAQQALQQQQGMMGNLATNQVNQVGNFANQQVQNFQGTEQIYQNAMNAFNQANLNNAASVNAANAGVNVQLAKNDAEMIMGAGKGLGSAIGTLSTMPSTSDGGEKFGPGYARGGMVHDGPSSNVGKYFKGGGVVQGKANVKGDSVKNDTVHARLSPGEIVIPRSVASDPDKAAAFARAVSLRSQRGKK